MVAITAIVIAGAANGSAFAAEGRPQLTVTAVSRPTNFLPQDHSGQMAYVVTVTNTGAVATDGSPITIEDELPTGLTPDGAGPFGEDRLAIAHGEGVGVGFKCALRTCVYTGILVPDDTLIVRFPVDVEPDAQSVETNVVRASGGGALDGAMVTPTTISATPAGFGISPGGATTALSTTQAGGHPDLTTSIAFNTVTSRGSLAGDPKDTTDDLPPGFAGDLVDAPTCSSAAFLREECPINTQVGVITLAVVKETFTEPVYNVVPSPGELSRLGFSVASVFFFEGSITLRPSDYGLRATFAADNQAVQELDNVSLTVWGVPADPVHDPLRWKRSGSGESAGAVGEFGASTEPPHAPFLTNPTSCSGELLTATFTVTSWEQPEESFPPTNMQFGPLAGCDRVTMHPALNTELTTPFASSPSGLDLGMSVPQSYDNPSGIATSTLKRAVITLPEGMTVNPSAGAGLGACTEAEFEAEPVQETPNVGCPNDSKIGTVKIESPAVKEDAEGTVFIAQPYANRFGSLLALYIVARIPNRGVIVKAAGEVRPNLVTGQLVTTFDNLPPLPFSVLTFKFIQGSTSPLVSPAACGEYTVRAQLTSAADPNAQPLEPEIPPFSISGGPSGGVCSPGGVGPFDPKVIAGSVNNEAGAYSPLYIRIVREDGEQEITRFSAVLPPGLTAKLSGVPFCPDASIEAAKLKSGAQEEAEPSCPAASQIGHTLVGAGVGPVLAQTPGRLYMAGPYNGAPFSIVAITSARVGPFDLGTVVVREALRIDPNTADVTVDASASDPIPHIIDGIVVHVRDIRVYVDRPEFSLNPTNCRRLTFAATVSGSGASFTNSADDVPVTVDDPFQAAECQALKFKPSFKASASGKNTRVRGASLKVTLTYPKGGFGTQANIRAVKVSLPKQMPSRLSTLQKACPDRTFNVNPAACPTGAIVGRARAITPILPVPLIGPAYFVSHGGAKFPELEIVLQGYGVTVVLHGETFINEHTNVTSSTFRAVPDQPVSSFELTLPQGSNSALAAVGQLCKDKLKMPTSFTAQNGLVFKQSTAISVSGCPKHVRRNKSHKRGGK
ncbi:MAG TPA: hypothetical protein VFW38_11375 [Solirubrobacteraceae bacterium]|nr:hypothetical protein [Solirubrobacteraceae bacterium]